MCFLFVFEDMITQLPASFACCNAIPAIIDLSSEIITQNKLFFSIWRKAALPLESNDTQRNKEFEYTALKLMDSLLEINFCFITKFPKLIIILGQMVQRLEYLLHKHEEQISDPRTQLSTVFQRTVTLALNKVETGGLIGLAGCQPCQRMIMPCIARDKVSSNI